MTGYHRKKVFPINKFENDLSQGSVAKKLFAFSMPFLLSNLIQALYNTADMIIVGQVNGTAAIAGVNIAGQITHVITNLVIGLSMGATVLIGQYKGRNERDGMRETISTLFSSLAFLALAITGIMMFAYRPLLRWLDTPAGAMKSAENYLFITMLGTVFIFGYNALSAVMRGMGDSKRPLVFVAISCVINVLLDLLLVWAFDMGAAGAAIATVFSQAVSMILCILYLKHNDFIFSFDRTSFRFYPERLRLLLKIGVPSSVQNVVVGFSFLFLTALVNSFGEEASAALGAVSKYNSFGILPTVAMSSAISAMVAQNIGAGEQKRALKTTWIGFGIAASLSAAIFVLTQLFPREILLLFDNNESMLEQGIPYMRVFSLEYLIVPLHFSLNGLFIGTGHTTFPLFSSITSSIIARVPAAYLFSKLLGFGMSGVSWGAVVASLSAALISLIFFWSGHWKKEVIHRK